MLPLLTPDPSPLAEFRQRGIAASLAWPADHDCDALVMVDADADNLRRFERWMRPAASTPGACLSTVSRS